MQQVPQWYIDGFNAYSREYRMMVYLYYEPGTLQDMRLYSDDVVDWDIVRELQDTGVPCAYLGSNSLILKIYNRNKRFLEDSEDIKYIQRGVRVKVSLDVPQGDGYSYFGCEIFTGWIDNYEFSDDAETVTVTAYDSLHYLMQQPSPKYRPSSDALINLKDMLNMYFRLCGCREIHGVSQEVPFWYVGYEVDENINTKVKPILDTKGTIGDVLKRIAQFGILAIFCNMHDVIEIQMIPRKRSEVYLFTDQEQVFSSSTHTNGYEDYTHVSINVYDACSKVLGTSATASHSFSTDDMVFKKGANEYNAMSLRESMYPTVVRFVSDTRMAQPNDMPLEPAVNKAGPPCWMGPMPMLGSYVYITDFDYSLDEMSLTVWAAKAVEYDFEILSYDEGRTVGSVVTYTDETEDQFFLMAKTLGIDNALFADKTYAEQAAFSYTKLITQGAIKIDMAVRGQPALELLDLIGVTNPISRHDDEQMLITRLHYTYDGNLECDIESLSYSAVMLMIYAYLGPGFYIPYDAGAMYITAKCDPPEAGIIEGTGAFAVGDITRLVCYPMSGYEIDHWEDTWGNRVEGATDTLVVQVEGTAEYKCILVIGTAFMTFTMDVNAEHPSVYIPPLAYDERVEGVIDWGDGMSEDYDSRYDYTHEYQIAGTMEITVKAPIHKLAAEIFKDSTQINTFTAGSDLEVMAGGTFYNSSVRNVNLLPATNLRFNEAKIPVYNTSYSTNFANIRPVGASSDGRINKFNNSAPNGVSISLNPTSSVIRLPKYVNGVLVTDVKTYNNLSRATSLEFPAVGYNYVSLDNTNVTPIIAMHEDTRVDTLSLNAIAVQHMEFNSPVRTVILNNVNISNLALNTPATYIANASTTTLTTLYLGTATERFDLAVAQPPLTTTVYVPDVATDYITDYSGSTLTVINYEGGDGNGNTP